MERKTTTHYRNLEAFAHSSSLTHPFKYLPMTDSSFSVAGNFINPESKYKVMSMQCKWGGKKVARFMGTWSPITPKETSSTVEAWRKGLGKETLNQVSLPSCLLHSLSLSSTPTPGIEPMAQVFPPPCPPPHPRYWTYDLMQARQLLSPQSNGHSWNQLLTWTAGGP